MKNKILIVICLIGQFVYANSITNIEPVVPEILKEYPSLRDFTINNTEDEAYFTSQSVLGEVSVIMKIVKNNGKWKKAEVASFSGKHHDLEPFLSADEMKLYFASKRPNDSSADANYDIWYVERNDTNNKWSKPINIGSAINSKHNEFYPSIAKNQNLYFTSNKEDSKGKDDIYFSEFKDGKYQPSYSISKSVNTDGDEYNAFISADESYLIFGAYNRQGGVGSGDLYVSYRNTDNSWSPALRLPEPINSKYMDYCPFVVGETLYFTSRRSDYNLEKMEVKNTKDLLQHLNKQQNGLSRIYKASVSNSLPTYQSHIFPNFLIGKWKVEDKETYEQWSKDKNNDLVGSSFKLIDGIEQISETIKISENDGNLVYSATVVNQNNGETIDFELNNKIFDKYIFENSKHDFPNQISYEMKSENQIFVSVSDYKGEGFSYNIYKQVTKKQIPAWFLSDLEKNIGTWTADNSAYKSENETQDKYEIQWQWGIGKTSITGTLYGYINGKKTVDYWHFRQYWDNASEKAMLVQYSNGGIQGIGEIKQLNDEQLETIQSFSNPSAQTWKTRHLSRNDGKAHYNSSWSQNTNGSWKQDREYIWHKSKI
jgi:hypothetical protein